MKRIYEWITKANQVLLFFVMIGGTALISYVIYQSFREHEPPHVAVAQTADEAKGSIVEDVRFLGHSSSGFYVFGIMKRVVSPGKGPSSKRYRLSSVTLGNEEEDAGEMVNVVFSKGEQRVRALLQNDGLVLSYNVPEQNLSEKLKALTFLCVTEDTDGNHRLDGTDRNDLYVVSEGLEKPDIVVKEVSSYRTTSPTHLVVKTGKGSVVRFWDVDTETQEKKEIVWK